MKKLVVTDFDGDDWVYNGSRSDGEALFRRNRLVLTESQIASVWGILKIGYAHPILNEQSGA